MNVFVQRILFFIKPCGLVWALSSAAWVWIADVRAQVMIHEEAVEMMPVDSELDIRAHVVIGLDPDEPFRRTRAWVPIRIELNNRDEDFEGLLIVQLKDGQMVYQTPVDLPARAKNLYTVYVYLPESLDELEFFLQTGKKKIEFEVVTVATPSVDSTRYVAVLSSERGSHEHLGHREENDRAEIFREVVYTSSLYLPKAWAGMENIDVLVWDGDGQLTLTPEQEAALDQWIQMGGTLVLACGDRWQQLNESGLRLYSPVTMSGSTVIPAQTRLTVNGEISRPVLIPAVVAATGELLDDPNINVRLQADGIPFLVERPWGAGRIVWVASSIRQPLFEPLYQEIFLRYIADSQLSHPPATLDLIDTPVTSFLRWLVQTELPGTAFVALYLGIYIVILVPVNYLIFRGIKRLEWAWFTIPVWAVIFAFGAYYIGSFSQHAEVLANQISVIRSNTNARYAESISYCSVYSPIRNWYTIRFENPKAFPMQIEESFVRSRDTLASTQNMTVTFEPAANRIDDFLIYHWSQRVFKTEHVMPVGSGVDMDIRFREDRLEGSISNHTPYILHAPRLVVKDRIVRLADLQPGDTVDVSGRRRNAEPLEKQNTWALSQQLDYGKHNRDTRAFVRDILADSYARYYFQSPETQSDALLAAHVEINPLQFQLDQNNVTPNGQSLFCVVSKVKQIMQGTRVIPPREWEYVDTGLLQSFSNYGRPGFHSQPYLEVQPQAEYGGMIQTALPLDQAEILWLKIAFDPNLAEHFRRGFRGNIRRLQSPALENGAGILIRNRITSRDEPLDEITDANGLLLNPDDYIDKANGRITFKFINPTDYAVRIQKEGLRISMEIDYGSLDDESFLGYSLRLAQKDLF